MIVYLDPEDYKEEARKKQEKKMAVPARPTTNQNERKARRNMRTDGMRTAAGFYPVDKAPNKREVIEEEV